MNCTDVQNLFGDYFDLSEDDIRRKCMDKHILDCSKCAEEFEIWSESTQLIQAENQALPTPNTILPIAHKVMDRIYQDESWRIPVQNRIYSIPFKLRRSLTAVIALFLAIFMFSLLYNLVDNTSNNVAASYGMVAVGTAPSIDNSISDTAVASTANFITEPIKLTMVSTPDYWLALSLLGLISALLTMNWLSRLKS